MAVDFKGRHIGPPPKKDIPSPPVEDWSEGDTQARPVREVRVSDDPWQILGHPLRRRALREFMGREEGVALAPVDMYKAWRANPRDVAYHVRYLASAGALEVVKETKIRGATRHDYKLTARGKALAAAIEAVAEQMETV